MEESDKILERLKKVDCPFTWKLDLINEVIVDYKESKTHDDENFVPLLKWMRSLVQAYEYVQKKDLAEAKESLKSAEEDWNTIKEKHEKDISLKVLDNIYKGTKCYILLEEDCFKEIDEILKTINDDVDDKDNAKQKSTVNGCKSIAWSKYKEAGRTGIDIALEFAKLAIKDNPDCDVWHFIAGKNMRRQRRLENFMSQPSKQEESEFRKAYALCKEPTFGIYLAQLHKEKSDKKQALRIYREIYELKPESASIHLRLALGFIRLRDLPLAKKCIDYAEQRVPEDSMFLHYKGIYLETTKQYKQAAECFLKASKSNNYAAAFSYLKCQAKSGVKYDFVQHLQEMLKTYSIFESRVLDITLQLAACYYMYNHDIPNAAKYYLEALEKYPNNEVFMLHECILGGRTNIYNFLKTDFLPNAFSYDKLDQDTKEICNKIKQVCDTHQHKQRNKVQIDFGRIKIN